MGGGGGSAATIEAARAEIGSLLRPAKAGREAPVLGLENKLIPVHGSWEIKVNESGCFLKVVEWWNPKVK